MDPRQRTFPPGRGKRWMTFAFLLTAACALLTALLAHRLFPVGPLSHHMIAHIALMNAAAPAAALALRNHPAMGQDRIGFRALAFFAALQLGLFFAWHSPPMAAGVMKPAVVSSAMQASLFAVAFFFWLAVFHQRANAFWRSVAALLITGKLFCLMAAVLVFSPRVLYGAGSSGLEGAVTLADQQLAGLIMVVVCPLAYVASAVFLTVRWLNELSRQSEPAVRKTPAEAPA